MKALKVFFEVSQNKGPSPKFAYNYYANLSELINLYFPWNQEETIGFLMIERGIEIN